MVLPTLPWLLAVLVVLLNLLPFSSRANGSWIPIPTPRIFSRLFSGSTSTYKVAAVINPMKLIIKQLFYRLGNCYIWQEQEISFMSGIKWDKILPQPKGWVQKTFQNLVQNFCEGLNKKCLKFDQFCIAWI